MNKLDGRVVKKIMEQDEWIETQISEQLCFDVWGSTFRFAIIRLHIAFNDFVKELFKVFPFSLLKINRFVFRG